MIIAVDFDGTIVRHRYPGIGKEIPFAVQTLKLLQRDGHRIILWTIRSGKLLDEAVEWCRRQGIEFYAINRNYPEEDDLNPATRKIKADIFIDDQNIGELPSWGEIYHLIREIDNYK